MSRLFVPCTLAVALAAQIQAQGEYIGFSYNVQVGATSRGSLGNSAGEAMTRIDARDYRGWGTNTAGTRTISSLAFIAQDQFAQPVAGTFAINLYPEDPANPHMPLISGVVPFATGVTGPTGTNTIAAVFKIVTPATPVSVPISGNGDIFVSFALGAVTATESMSIQIDIGYQPSTAFTIFDLAGPAQGPVAVSPNPPLPITVNNTHGVSLVGTTLFLNGRRMQYLDVAQTTAAAGTALTITNQTSFTCSNSPPPAGFGPAPGTSDFLSGVAPDIGGSNAGRADDITFDFFKTGIGTGRPVFFLMDLSGGFAATELPVSAFSPGSGVVCINLASASVISLQFTATDEAFVTTTIPNNLRSMLSGLRVIQQAAGIDANNQIVASTCASQTF